MSEHPEQIELSEDDDLSAEAIHERLREAELQRILTDDSEVT